MLMFRYIKLSELNMFTISLFVSKRYIFLIYCIFLNAQFTSFIKGFSNQIKLIIITPELFTC